MKFIAVFLSTFLLTELLYPRPLVSISRKGYSVSFAYPPDGLCFSSFTKIDFLVVLLVAFCTTIALLLLQHPNSPLSRYAKEKWWFYMILWIFFMGIFSLLYLWYGYNVDTTGGVE